MDLATGNDGKTMKIRPFETNNQINMQGAAVLQNDHVDSFFCSLPLKNADSNLLKNHSTEPLVGQTSASIISGASWTPDWGEWGHGYGPWLYHVEHGEPPTKRGAGLDFALLNSTM